VELRLLGPLEVSRHGRPTGPARSKVRRLALIAGANHFVSVDDLIAGLWEEPSASALNPVQARLGLADRPGPSSHG
jgi:DNA-binding SARP family transcriptional activator